MGNKVGDAAIPGPWSYNGLNQLTQAGPMTFAYDASGNQTEKTEDGQTTHYVYNLLNQLVEIRDPQNQAIAAYAYDALGRRTRKTLNPAAAPATMLFTYADEGLVADLVADGSVQRSFGYPMDAIWGNNPLWLKHPDGYAYFLNNAKGEPNRLVTRDGLVVWSGLHHGFGLVEVDPASTLINPLRLSSQYFDEESTLHYNTYRSYDPQTGRYLQPDPINEESFRLGVVPLTFMPGERKENWADLYLPAKNNFLTFSDYIGLFPTRWACVKNYHSEWGEDLGKAASSTLGSEMGREANREAGGGMSGRIAETITRATIDRIVRPGVDKGWDIISGWFACSCAKSIQFKVCCPPWGVTVLCTACVDYALGGKAYVFCSCPRGE